ncbi:kinase-like protein [Mytilinidion resinicola]|uniref:Kinase-like protein n=1 Tax=Mytilinidion resinicola TaxID=574789 RepID=A0A6A6Y8Z1_9PEZI|nr:kinase-like protein [Mytilinidion resinicola]KAF2805160.1 kinase-like protein [Mytilinidion resinicola]
MQLETQATVGPEIRLSNFDEHTHANGHYLFRGAEKPKSTILHVCVEVKPRSTEHQILSENRTLNLPAKEPYSEVQELICNVLERHHIEGECKGRFVILERSGSCEEFPIASRPQFEQAMEDFHIRGYDKITYKATFLRIEGRVTTTSRQQLFDAIHKERIQNKNLDNENDAWFVPVDRLLEIISETAVTSLFQDLVELKSKTRSEITDICRKAPRLLATLVLAGFDGDLGHLLSQFLQHRMYDNMMPFSDSAKYLPWFCNDEQHQRICMFQWQTIAIEIPPPPKGGQGNRKRAYSSKHALPLEDVQQVGAGGFGMVYRIKVKASHQKAYKLANDPNPYLAMKEAKREGSKEDYEKEWTMLTQLEEFGHQKHLIRLLTAFQHGDKYYLIFPFARSDLQKHFQLVDPRGQNQSKYVIWTLEQLQGLAEGLNHIHQDVGNTLQPNDLLGKPVRFGYHHDLKPENLLLFVQMDETFDEPLKGLEVGFGRIVMSDFGLGKFRTQIQGSATETIRGSEVYAAPEAGARSLERKQARAYDIWSLGCIVLEFIVWLKEGSDGLETFACKRSGAIDFHRPQITTQGYYHYDQTGTPQLRPEVLERIEFLKRHCTHQAASGPILRLLGLVERCLRISPDSRPRADQVAKELKFILSVAKNSAGNFFRDIPYS